MSASEVMPASIAALCQYIYIMHQVYNQVHNKQHYPDHSTIDRSLLDELENLRQISGSCENAAPPR